MRKFFPTSRVSQPQQHWAINWGNPLAHRLAFLYAGGAGPIDHVSGRRADTWNGSIGPSRYGRGVIGDGSNITAEWNFCPLTASNMDGTGGASYFALANPISEARISTLIGVYIGGAPFTQIELFANLDGSSGLAQSGTLCAETYAVVSYANATGIIDGAYHSFAGCWDSSNPPIVYADGVNVTGAAAGIGINFGTSSSLRIAVGNEPYTAARAANATIPFAAAWNRYLSPAEIASLNRNPWQLFVNSRAVWFNALAVAAAAAMRQRALTGVGY